MRPWTLLGTATVPGEGAALRMMQRGDEFVIMAGTNPLMNSRMSGSEEDLATLSWSRVAGRRDAHVLIGGLGMGFTLRAALAAMPQDARITVAELVPEIVEWARGPLAPIFAGSLDDPRVTIAVDDVGRLIGTAKARYDAILLDVDNGPEGLSRDGTTGSIRSRDWRRRAPHCVPAACSRSGRRTRMQNLRRGSPARALAWNRPMCASATAARVRATRSGLRPDPS